MLRGKLARRSWIVLRFGELGAALASIAAGVDSSPAGAGASANPVAGFASLAPPVDSVESAEVVAPSIAGGTVEVAEAGVCFLRRMFSQTHTR